MKEIYKIYKELQNNIIAPKDKTTEFGRTKYNYRDVEDILKQIKAFLKDKDYLFYTTEGLPTVYGEMPIEYDISRFDDKYGNQKTEYLVKSHPLIMKCIKAILTNGEDTIETEFYYPYEFNTTGMSQGQLGGSNNTYNKKYNLGNALLFDDGKDLDSQEFQNLRNNTKDDKPKKAKVNLITPEQVKQIKQIKDDLGITIEHMQAINQKFKIKSITELTDDKYKEYIVEMNK